MPYFSKSFAETALATKDSPSSGYLNPSSIEDGGSIRFAILSESPLEGYEAWFIKEDGGKTKRHYPERPDDALLAQLAKEGLRVEERDGRKQIKAFSAFFCYSYEEECVKLFSANQVTLLRDIERLTSEDDYSNLNEWDMKINRTGKETQTRYTVSMLPTKRSNTSVAKRVLAAWEEACDAGANIEALFEVGGNPFGGGPS